MKANRTKEKNLSRLVIVTIIAVYLLILAGGIVRSTGSGMGCPDWPKCFGSWVPPSSESALPANYQQTFSQIRVQKNHRLAGYLEVFGFNALAESLRNESMAAPEAEFNKFKTWTEYINRLLGVFVGMLITLMAVMATGLRKAHPKVFYGCIAAFFLVAFQGWVGSVVVSTNLLPGMVTLHMALAGLLIFLLIYLAYHIRVKSTITSDQVNSKINRLLVASMVLIALQIALGTQVREAIDVIALQFGAAARDLWIGQLGSSFYFHRSFSLIILGVCGYLYYQLRNYPDYKLLANLLILLIGLETLFGVIMAYFAIPPWVQPLHLTVGLLVLGLQYWTYLKINNPKQI